MLTFGRESDRDKATCPQSSSSVNLLLKTWSVQRDSQLTNPDINHISILDSGHASSLG